MTHITAALVLAVKASLPVLAASFALIAAVSDTAIPSVGGLVGMAAVIVIMVRDRSSEKEIREGLVESIDRAERRADHAERERDHERHRAETLANTMIAAGVPVPPLTDFGDLSALEAD